MMFARNLFAWRQMPRARFTGCLLGVLILTAGCKLQVDPGATNSSSLASRTSQSGYDVLIAQCFAPQGNGGNWAATLGWLSETIHLRILEADILAKQGKRVGLHLGCIVGGSSGSVVTAALSHILTNQKLLPGKNSQSVLSPTEARLVVRALRFVALAADYNLRELVRFLVPTVGNVTKQKLLEASARVFGSEKPSWWDDKLGTVVPKYMLVDFATSLQLAATLTPELLSQPLSTALQGRELGAYTSRSATTFTDIPEFGGLVNIPRTRTDEGKIFARGFEQQSDFLSRTADSFVAKQFQPLEYKRRHARDLGRNGGDYKLKTTLDAGLAEGMCTITMASLLQSEAETSRQPRYEELSPVVFCSEATARAILSSKTYQQKIKDSDPYVTRFVVAVVPTMRGAIVPSIREPALMPPLSGQLAGADGGELEVTKFYSPKWDRQFRGALTFQLFDARSVEAPTGMLVTPYLAVGGGFPDRRISAWMASLFFVHNIESKLRPLAGEVHTNFAIFGRANVRGATEFHKNAVQNVFSSGASGDNNLEDWLSFADAWCSTMVQDMQRSFKTRLDNVTLDWEVSKLPAAQTPGGASNLLLVKAINATRTQAGRHLAGLRVVFDPEVESHHVPTLATPHPCAER